MLEIKASYRPPAYRILQLALGGRHLGMVVNFLSGGWLGFAQVKQWGVQGLKEPLCESIRSSRTGWKRVCTHPLPTHRCAQAWHQCVAAPSSQFAPGVANLIHRSWGVVESLASLLVSTSLLSWMFGSWSPPSGAGLRVSNSSREIPKIIFSPSATEVWQHSQMSLSVREIFRIFHPLEWRLPTKCLFSTVSPQCFCWSYWFDF